jgi:hypothetical protein
MATPFETKYIFMSFDLSTTSVMKYIYIYVREIYWFDPVFHFTLEHSTSEMTQRVQSRRFTCPSQIIWSCVNYQQLCELTIASW